ncbi:hypothetical protein EJB05_21795, partial [Eragrostis curvula]
MVMPRPSSSGLQSIRRELQRRKQKAALAPTRPACKKTSAPLPRDKCLEPRPCPSPEQDPSSNTSRSSVSASPAPPPLQSVSSSVGCASHMKPGTKVQVRTRTQMVIDGRTLVLWLPATVVSSAADGDGGYYEVIYEGNLPRDDPFSTVRVPLHHVRAIKPPPQPPSQPPSGASAKNQGTQPTPRPTTAGKSLRILHKLPRPEMQPAPRPTTEGKSLRLLHKLAPPEMKPAPRPTTAGKSFHVVRSIIAQKEHQALDSYSSSTLQVATRPTTRRSDAPAASSHRHQQVRRHAEGDTNHDGDRKPMRVVCNIGPEMNPRPGPSPQEGIDSSFSDCNSSIFGCEHSCFLLERSIDPCACIASVVKRCAADKRDGRAGSIDLQQGDRRHGTMQLWLARSLAPPVVLSIEFKCRDPFRTPV